MANYAYIYNFTGSVIALEAAIPFDTNGPMVGFVHLAGTPEIVTSVTGVYLVNTSASGLQPNQFAVAVNGTAVPESVYGAGAGTQETIGQLILNLSAGDVVTMINHSSSAAITLQSLAGGTVANVDASIVIQQLG